MIAIAARNPFVVIHSVWFCTELKPFKILPIDIVTYNGLSGYLENIFIYYHALKKSKIRYRGVCHLMTQGKGFDE